MTNFKQFDISDHLKTQEDIDHYINDAFEEIDNVEDDKEATGLVLETLRTAATAERKMSAIARRADVGRESLYHSLNKDANPSFRTILSAIRELGGNLRITPRKAVA
ncbi:putative addiction module antidote protein [Bifidobacterium sp. ESL0690]|uniref:addiction module antidote protein n=1 Tax=Bifidobacterium sp. ESL0690 TaxID=2983214 RepID=UPI0023F628E2|nr:addiction module antidote protein [Bifidobacterium sp. ESL0690]WEV46733.1 putative addiction module antidote protein [Bifidobacterium sp. ESL0690]